MSVFPCLRCCRDLILFSRQVEHFGSYFRCPERRWSRLGKLLDKARIVREFRTLFRTPKERREWEPVPFRWWSDDCRKRGPVRNPTLHRWERWQTGFPDWQAGPNTDPFFDWPNDPRWWHDLECVD